MRMTLGTNPLMEDSDADGRNDGYEVANGQAPNDNSDGTFDPDNDNSNNEEEFARGTDPNDADTDDDMLTDGAEDGTGTYVDAAHTGTNPLLADSDGDGLSDGVENPSLPYLNASQPEPTRTSRTLTWTDSLMGWRSPQGKTRPTQAAVLAYPSRWVSARARSSAWI